jgi:putative ABC transport system substrate-binding protein
LAPKAVRIAVLHNPDNPGSAERIRDITEGGRALGLQIAILNASTSREVEAALANLVRDRADAVFVDADVFFTTQAAQIATLVAHYRIPAVYTNRAYSEVGGLMSYGPNESETCRQVGIYTGQILKGRKPADMPVQQVTKIELVINLKTAKALGLDVPLGLSAAADELIE